MPKAEIWCQKCRKWFKSPIAFTTMRNFDTATLSGNKFTCPSCRSTIPMNKENMRVVGDGEGFVGKDTK